MYDNAFSSYPVNPVKAMPAEPPGTGGTVNIMSTQLFPPPTPLDQNPAWQAVNKALNANVNYQIVTSADYPVKLGTVMAGNDLPDLLYMYARPGAPSTLAAAAGVPQFLQSQTADLTPNLAGDAAKEQPATSAICSLQVSFIRTRRPAPAGSSRAPSLPPASLGSGWTPSMVGRMPGARRFNPASRSTCT